MGGLLAVATAADSASLSWPLACPDGSERNCLSFIGKPDLNDDNIAHDCGKPGYKGHTGTDLHPDLESVRIGTQVLAAAPGIVAFAYDGFFDKCPSEHRECQPGNSTQFRPGYTGGYTRCSRLVRSCNNTDAQACFFCFGGNHVVIRHQDIEGVFATAYLHLRRDSVEVVPGQRVGRGDVLGLVASSGRSTTPHLHFEIWENGYYKDPVDPWAGECGRVETLWME